MTGGSERAAALAANLTAVRARIDAAAMAAGRDPAALTLVAISKTWPAADVAVLAGLGVTDFGENRAQEARPKVAEVAGLLADAEPASPASVPPRWHFVGRLQSNKVRPVAAWADWVHSVDRLPLVAALDAAAARAGRVLTVCVQVSLDRPAATGRGGAPPAEVSRLADSVAQTTHLRLAGLMAVAPLGEPPEPAFERLAEAHKRVLSSHPGASVLSAGMSGDLEAAVAHGATHLRVGTALFGARPPFP